MRTRPRANKTKRQAELDVREEVGVERQKLMRDVPQLTLAKAEAREGDLLERLIRSWIRVCARHTGALDSQLECAELLLAARHDDAARLLYDVVFIQQGFGPPMRRAQAAVATRTRLWPGEIGFTADDLDPSAPSDAFDMARREIVRIIDLDLADWPAIVHPPLQAERDGDIGKVDDPETAIAQLCAALRHHLQQAPNRDRTELVGLLRRLGRMCRTCPAYDLDDVGVAVPVHAARLAFNILKRFTEFRAGLMFAPHGGAGLFHALAQLPAGGLGPYASNLDRLCPSSNELSALVDAGAAGRIRAAEDVDRWMAVLAGQLRDEVRRDLVDDLGDRGQVSTLHALLRHETTGLRPPDRIVLERLRDVGLDLDALSLAREAQQGLTTWWADDISQWHVLGDIAGLDGRLEDAEAAFRVALDLRPDDTYAANCLSALAAGNLGVFFNRGGYGTPEERKARRRTQPRASEIDLLAPRVRFEDLAPELLPNSSGASGHRPHDGYHIRRVGIHRQHSRWGYLPVLRGVEAIRGFFVGAVPIVEMRIDVNGRTVHKAVPRMFRLADNRRKSVFNAWIDFSALPDGCYDLTLIVIDADLARHEHRERVLIVPALVEADYPSSDTVVAPPPDSGGDLDHWIEHRPSMIRSATRAVYAKPDNILVVRADQLGDLVCSLPALRRLRSMFPQARITGLFTPANAELAYTLDVLDEVIVIAFPDDAVERRRTMPLARQEELYRELRGRHFDLAIDLADIGPARPLLRLTGAPLLYGARRGEFPFLSFGFDGGSVDPVNGSENVPAVNKMVGLMSWLDILGQDIPNLERRSDLPRSRLVPLGIAEADRFAVLHAGAQLTFSRWPHYPALAELLLQQTDLVVVLICDDTQAIATLSANLRHQARFILIDKRLAFDDLDALLSYASLFVGNDSGPKHLASLRGAPVVSLHCARNNWNEWGQSNGGAVISRRVPCAGCQISRDPEECGRDFVCLTKINPAEVLEASLRIAQLKGERL